MPDKQKKSASQNEAPKDTLLVSSVEAPEESTADISHYKPVRFWQAKRAMSALVCIIFLFFVCTATLLRIGLRGQFLDDQIHNVLSEKLGEFVQTEIHGARLSLDTDFHIALEVSNVPVRHLPGNIRLNRLGMVRFGLSTGELIRGKVQVSQVELQDAEIFLPNTGNRNIAAYLPQDNNRRIDFDAVSDMLFASAEHLLEGFGKQAVNSLILENILFRFQVNNTRQSLSVAYLKIRYRDHAIKLDGQLEWNGQLISLESYIERDAAQWGQTFAVTVKGVPVHLGAKDDITPYLADGRINNAHFRMKGTADIRLQGIQAHDGKPRRILAFFSLSEGYTDISVDKAIIMRLELEAAYNTGSGDIEILPSKFVLGGVRIPFKGVIGSMPRGDGATDITGKYHFELTADKGVSAPQDSPEYPLQFELKLAGRFLAEDRRAVFDRFLLQTEYGNLLGQGSLRFGEGSPETIFVLRVPRMPVHEIKQLWPVNIARGTRLWVLSHVFGGELSDSTIEIALPGGFFKAGKIPPLLTGQELKIKAHVKNFRSDLIGNIPALREGFGNIIVKGTATEIQLDHAIAYVDDDERLEISEGVMTMAWIPLKPLLADLSIRIRGAVGSVGKLLDCDPVNAVNKIPFDVKKASGTVSVLLKLNFPVMKRQRNDELRWEAWIDFQQFSLSEPWRGTTAISNAAGSIHINSQIVELKGDGLLNGIPASVEMSLPTAGSNVKKQEKIIFRLDDQIRNRFFPALNSFLTGDISVEIGSETNARRHIVIDLSKATFEIPWMGWKKGSGIAAKAEMTVGSDINTLKNIEINDFDLSGATFQIAGKIVIKNGNFVTGDFSKISFNRNDKLRLSIKKNDKTCQIKLTGQSFDMRSLIKHLSETNSRNSGGEKIEFIARIDNVGGFYGENLTNFRALYNRDLSGYDNISVEGVTGTNYPAVARISRQNDKQSIHISTGDAGSVLRFMNFYDKIHAGRLEATLQSVKGAPLSGPVSISGFQIINDPRFASIVSTSPSGGGKSLNEAVKGKIDVSRVVIDQAFGQIAKGDNYLVLDRGVIRGPTIGATFQGVVYDASGNIAMTGTFMPGYGLNRLFSDVPVLGTVLGNGRDRGLIGITFKIEGSAKMPRVVVNPISVIAPGIFRSIFEFK